MNILAWLSVFLAIFAIFPSLVSGVGLAVVLVSNLFAGIAAAGGKIKFAALSGFISIINVLVISVFSQADDKFSWSWFSIFIIIFLPIPVGFALTYLLTFRKKLTSNPQ